MGKIKEILSVTLILALLVSGSVLFLLSTNPGVAQDTETVHLAPLNPDFVDYLENPPEEFYGDIPPPIDLSHVDQLPVERL